MHTALNIAEKYLRLAAMAMAALGGTVMLVMLVVITANIAMRPFGGSIRGAVEISGYLCALAVGLCMPAAQIAGGHIAAGVWASSLPPRVRLLQNGFGSLLCAALLACAAWELCGLAGYARDMGEYIEGFGFSYHGMTLGFAAGIALHAAIFVHAALRVLFPGSGGAA